MPQPAACTCQRGILGPLQGQVLKDSFVLEARAVEVSFFKQKIVLIKVPRPRLYEKTGRPPISTRWIDMNKGDDEHPNNGL